MFLEKNNLNFEVGKVPTSGGKGGNTEENGWHFYRIFFNELMGFSS